MNRRGLLVGGAGAIALAGIGAALVGRPAAPVRWRGEGDCGPKLTRADLDEAIRLGGAYLQSAQKPTGDFVYEVDWTTGKLSADENGVRQAGATWGLALLHHDTGEAAVRAALDKSLALWVGRAASSGDRTWVVDGSRGQTGTLSLVGLSLVERLRAPAGLDEATRAGHEAMLDGIIAQIRATRRPDGGFASAYNPTTGDPSGAPNPYADGEALLLLAKAGVHLERPALVALALECAARDHERNVAGPLAAEPDPDTTKGYYQWASMSWHELAVAGHEPDKLGEWLGSLAVWMVDAHRTLQRTRNTAYAYEGLLSAYHWASTHGQTALAAKLGCVAHQGLRKLFSWQLGHPLAPDELRQAPAQFHGGVQNMADDPLLRIDVTQHQLHAAILARRYEVDRASLPG